MTFSRSIPDDQTGLTYTGGDVRYLVIFQVSKGKKAILEYPDKTSMIDYIVLVSFCYEGFKHQIYRINGENLIIIFCLIDFDALALT